MSPQLFVPECECNSGTNESGLGGVQRAILRYLRTAPEGFGGVIIRSASGECQQHGGPIGVTVEEIAAALYSEPTASHRRMIQRAARQLETRGLADCWHGSIGERPRELTDLHGGHHTSTQPMPGLYVAARWDCPHLRAYLATRAEYKPAATLAELAANLAAFAAPAAP
jgi:hypothetical protein